MIEELQNKINRNYQVINPRIKWLQMKGEKERTFEGFGKPDETLTTCY
jgi:hypothetical protein